MPAPPATPSPPTPGGPTRRTRTRGGRTRHGRTRGEPARGERAAGAASASREQAAPSQLPPAVLVAVVTALTLELVRASGPLLDVVVGRAGVGAAAGAALLTYAAPGVVVLALTAVGRARLLALVLGAVLLGVLRLAVQGLRADLRLGVGLAAVAVAVAVLTLAVDRLARTQSGSAAAGAVGVGAAGGVGIHLGLDTWDAVWRTSLLGWSVSVAAVTLLMVAAVVTARQPAPPGASTRPGGRLWALGPVLALVTMMLANPAFAAAQAGMALALAGPVLAIGLLLASAAVLRTASPARPASGLPPPSGRRPWIAAVALVAGVGAALTLGGALPGDQVLVLLALVAGQAAAFALLGRALTVDRDHQTRSRPGGSAAAGRTAAAAALTGLGAIGPLLLHQLHYDVALGFPNALVLVAAAAALAVAGLRRSGPDGRLTRPAAEAGWRPATTTALLAAGAVLVVLGTGSAAGRGLAGRPDVVTTGPAAGGTVVCWNLHYGVTASGEVDLEAIARTIEAYDPDVVLLQEVSRGWVLGGGADMATWLAQRLDRHVVFAPAADRRFGNVILSRTPPDRVRVLPLPFGAGPQRRSALSADVVVDGRPVRVTSVHLQQRAANTPTRLAQLDTLLAALGNRRDGTAQVLGGDLNAPPGSPELDRLTGAGFVSAIDVAGDPTVLTHPSDAPTRRIDWVLGRGTGFAEAQVLGAAQQSDHLPVVVTLR